MEAWLLTTIGSQLWVTTIMVKIHMLCVHGKLVLKKLEINYQTVHQKNINYKIMDITIDLMNYH